MSKEEKIELAYWIAVNLFHKHAFENNPVNHALCEVCGKNCRDEVHVWPSYTDDPAAAMDVLSKCLEVAESDLTFFRSSDDNTYKVFRMLDVQKPIPPNKHWVSFVEAETIPLSICLYAKKLFTK